MSRGERAWQVQEATDNAHLRLLGTDSLVGALLGHAPAQARFSLPATAASACKAAAPVSMQPAVTVSTARERSFLRKRKLSMNEEPASPGRRQSASLGASRERGRRLPAPPSPRTRAPPAPRAPSDARRLRKGSAQSLPESEPAVRRGLCWSTCWYGALRATPAFCRARDDGALRI